MSALLHHLALIAKSRSGLGASVIIAYLVAAVALVTALVFGCVALLVWLADRYGAQAATLIMAGGFLLLAVIAALAGSIARSRRMARARLELAASRRAGLLDPRLLSVGLEVGRTLGWRRIIALAAAGLFAAGLAREWSNRERKEAEPTPPE
jgi:MFS family permease